MRQHSRMMRRTLRPATAAAGLVVAALLAAAPTVRSGEIIPSIGLTKNPDSQGDASLFGGVAFRGSLAPVLKTEIGIQYRNEEHLDGNLDIRQWPVTASLWLQPVPAFYAGGGVGWYHTTYDYNDDLPFPEDDTSEDFGVHLGGGFRVPLAPTVAMDLNGRYVFLDEIESEFEDLGNLDPNYWSLSLGLALGF